MGVVVVVGDRSKVIPLHLTNGDTVTVKLDTDEGLVEMQVKPKMATRKRLVALGQQHSLKARQARENLEKGRETREANMAELDAATQRFLGCLSDGQRRIVEVLFRKLRFDSKDRPIGYTTTAGKWVQGVLAVCPNPERLDFAFLQKWLTSPHTAANAKPSELTGGRKGSSAMHIRRAVARKQFITAWEEQVGPISISPKVQPLGRTRGVVSQVNNHPFSVIHHWIVEGKITKREEIEDALSDYADSGALTSDDLSEARRMLAANTWMGENL